jgi:hypothetical protein
LEVALLSSTITHACRKIVDEAEAEASLVYIDCPKRRFALEHVHSARRTLRHLVAYGSTNKYRPVNRSNASGRSGE